MQLLRILGRSLVDCFCHYVVPLTAEGSDYAGPQGEAATEVRRGFARCRIAATKLQLLDARDELERMVRSNPTFLGGRLLLAAVLSDLGKPGEARGLFDALLVERGEDGRLWFLAGQLAERCGEMERAMECYQSARQHGGRSACEAAERLAAIHLASGDPASAREPLAWLVEARPEEFCVRVELAGVLSLLGEHEAATKVYEDAILLEPDNWDARQDLAATLEAQERYSEALSELRLVLDEHPYLADLNLRAARLCARLKDREGARRHVDAALEANPRYLEAICLKGLLLIDGEDPRAAMAAFHRALEINDDYVMAYAGLALAQEQCGRSQESGETMRLAQAIAPGSESIYARLADVGLAMALENRRPATSAVDRAWAGNRFANLRLAGSLDEQGDAGPEGQGEGEFQGDHDEKVQVQLEKHRSAVERFPRYADLRYYYGLLLASVGRPEEALEQYRAAVEINPQYTEALVRLALGYWRAGRADEARHALAKAGGTSGDQLKSHYRFGVLWADRGVWPLVMEQLATQAGGMSRGTVNGAIAAAMQNLGVSDSRSREYLSGLKLADHRDQRQGSAVSAQAKQGE